MANLTPEQVARERERDRTGNRAGKGRADRQTRAQLERTRAKAREWVQRDRALHPEKWAAYKRDVGAKRKAAELRATPAWADMGAIKAIYIEAVRLQYGTGTPHHVDHIVPLVGKAYIDGKLCARGVWPARGTQSASIGRRGERQEDCRHWPDMP